MSLVTGDGGTELARIGNSTDKLKADAVWPLFASCSEPELISADTRLRSRAKVTFFSSLGSGASTVWLEAGELMLSKKDVSFSSVIGSAAIGGFRWLSDIWIISPRLNLGRGAEDCGILGEISCCRI